MHSNSDGSTGFLCIIFSIFFFSSVILILHYQLLFLQSGRFPGKKNWTGVQLDLESLSSVLEIWSTFQNWSTHIHRVFSWNVEMQTKSSQRGRDGFCFEVWLNAVRMLRPSPIHLALKSTTLEKRQLVV